MRKCIIKKRFNVGFDTENPPQSHCANKSPMYAIADKILVITVAPPKSPHGMTYPINEEVCNEE